MKFAGFTERQNSRTNDTSPTEFATFVHNSDTPIQQMIRYDMFHARVVPPLRHGADSLKLEPTTLWVFLFRRPISVA